MKTHKDSLTFGLLMAILIGLCACTSEEGVTVSAGDRTTAGSEKNSADVVIVGAGISGLSAAIEVAASGRSVLLLDMGSVFGGHAVVAAGVLNIPVSPMQQQQGIEDSYPLAYDDFVRWGEDVNEPWTDYYVKHAKQDIYDWVTGLGVNFLTLAQPAGNSVPRVHVPEGFGLDLVTRIYREALRYPTIKMLWNTRADSLLQRDGRVIGVSVTQLRSGRQYDYFGAAVVIASGGFQSNIQRVLDNWPASMTRPNRLLTGSGVHSMGSGLELATKVGAQLHRMDHQWNYVTGLPNPAFADSNRGLSYFPVPGKPRFDIWINDEGQRFANECESPKYTLPRLLAQPNQRYWSVFDSNNKPNMTISGPGWTPERLQREVYDNPALVSVADSLDELAEKTGLAKAVLKQSIAQYNAQVIAGVDSDFSRFGADSGSVDKDCGQAQVLETPPYYAVRLYPLARKSMGGVKVDLGTQVLDKEGHPVAGLYAVGEVTGFAGINGKAGLEGTFLGPAIVMGRVAGRTISMDLAKNTHTAVAAKEVHVDDFSIHPLREGQTACGHCHLLDEQIDQGHPGYQHFDDVHRQVQQRDLHCQTCHASLFPYDPNRHQWDSQLQTMTCVICHGGGD